MQTVKTPRIEGGKYLTPADRKALIRDRKEAAQRKRRSKRLAVLGLIVCDAAMMAMILNGLINNTVGMVFLAVISALFGWLM